MWFWSIKVRQKGIHTSWLLLYKLLHSREDLVRWLSRRRHLTWRLGTRSVVPRACMVGGENDSLVSSLWWLTSSGQARHPKAPSTSQSSTTSWDQVDNAQIYGRNSVFKPQHLPWQRSAINTSFLRKLADYDQCTLLHGRFTIPITLKWHIRVHYWILARWCKS